MRVINIQKNVSSDIVTRFFVDDVEIELRVKFHTNEKAWYITRYSEVGGATYYGIKIVPLFPLFLNKIKRVSGGIFLLPVASTDAPLTFENMNVAYKLVYLNEKEFAFMRGALGF